MQIPISVVTLGGAEDAMRSFCSGYPGSIILGHGHITLPAYREGLTYRVFSAEQGKSVSLPYWGSEAVRRIDGDADSGTEKKRRLPCNRADRGCGFESRHPRHPSSTFYKLALSEPGCISGKFIGDPTRRGQRTKEKQRYNSCGSPGRRALSA